MANLIDYGDLAFARAEVATLRRGVRARRASPRRARDPGREGGGNLVVLAGDRPVDARRVGGAADRARERDCDVLTGPGLEEWVGDAEVLTDDHAPVDQLLQPYVS